MLEDSSTDILENQKDEHVSPRAFEPETSLKAKYEKLPSHIIRSRGSWKRQYNTGKNRRYQEKRKTKYEID